MHSLAFHMASSLSEWAHYRQNPALTLSQPALLCIVFTLAPNVSSLKASVWSHSSGWEGARGRKRNEDDREVRCKSSDRPGRKEEGVHDKERGGKLFDGELFCVSLSCTGNTIVGKQQIRYNRNHVIRKKRNQPWLQLKKSQYVS